MFSILHISDLHRSPDDPVDNDTLLATLLADRDRYLGETPVVPSPDAIVITGDLIHGAPISHPNWQKVIGEQYNVAEDFLDHLTRRFLAGDRSRLIIIPGNHDVCWNTSFTSMVKLLETEYPSDVWHALIKPDSIYRWSWAERALYQIRDTALYNSRMNAYWDFVENFYAKVSLLRPLDRRRGFQLFELHDRQIVLAAFDSISSNDCFSYSGAIPRGAVAQCALALRDIPHTYDLRIAAWHHSISGPPKRDDYMDNRQVREMVGLNFQLGMHGHQHVADAATHYVHVSAKLAMAVVCAGSLCAGNRELPRGVNRQYNLVVIEDDLRRARVHVREIGEGEQFSRKNNGTFSQGFVEVEWKASTDIMGREIKANEQNSMRVILRAEEALHASNPRKAIELLEGIELSQGSYARKILIQAALTLEDWPLLVSTITQPQSIEEAVLLVSALIRTNALTEATAMLSSNQDIDATTRKDLEEQIETNKMMRCE